MLSRLIAILLLIILIPVFLIVSIIIVLYDGFPIIFKQKRIGKNNNYFYLYKFRTMNRDCPEIATHLMSNPEKYIIKYGNFFRKYSLDEIPQLFNIVKSDMHFIGPRPALHNQIDLKELRTKNNIHLIKPGLTGWAQVNGRDNISIIEKVDFEKFYIKNHSILLDLKIIFLTLFKVVSRKGVSH